MRRMPYRPRPVLALVTLLAVFGPLLAAGGARAYTLFESDPVRPLALSPDGAVLAVANAPEGTLELYSVDDCGLAPLGSVPVGLEPVAVAWRDGAEVWVVNHLSDSVSVVALDRRAITPPRNVGALVRWLLARALGAAPPGRVARTLLVGDEPRDIVFAGPPERRRAFVTTAHRGQNAPDPQLTTPGVGRADVWVFAPGAEPSTLGGAPETIITLFTDTPRALAVSPDGLTVYAAGFHTGNRTTTVFESEVEAGGGLPAPNTDAAGAAAPEAGLIVQHDGTRWVGPAGRTWDAHVMFELPDLDVFTLDASADPPAEVPGGAWSGVGTTLFGMAVHPITGAVFVANTDANNATRFEGHGGRGTSVRGDLHRARVTILRPGEAPVARRLNPHLVDDPVPWITGRRASLATPMAPTLSADGTTLYVAGFGSGAVGVYDVASLVDGTLMPAEADHIRLGGGGPSGIALDEARGRAYVTTRFDNAVAIVDLAARAEIGRVWLRNPEPLAIREGRRFLYDAQHTSANGEASCASCHVFGDMDHLAWDLGDPDGIAVPNPNPAMPFPLPQDFDPAFSALKGPMTTQTLRGMDNHGPMHWRGDRTGAYAEASAQPDAGAYDERAAFRAFNGAFVSLLGRDAPLPEAEMDAFAEFALALTMPPNPIRALDGRDSPLEARGRALYFGDVVDTFASCAGCHTLDPAGNAAYGVERPGFFGTDGRWSFAANDQPFKVPQLRNAYQKVGMFGLPEVDRLVPGISGPPAAGAPAGAQIRGFGFTHDGAVDTLARFFSARNFAQRAPGTGGPLDPGNPTGLSLDAQGIADRRALEAFVHAYPSNLAPIVGQQVTVSAANRAAAEPRVALMVERAEAGDCDLVASAVTDRRARSGLYVGDGRLQTDDGRLIRLDDALAVEGLTLTCVPPGEGDRYAFDRLR